MPPPFHRREPVQSGRELWVCVRDATGAVSECSTERPVAVCVAGGVAAMARGRAQPLTTPLHTQPSNALLAAGDTDGRTERASVCRTEPMDGTEHIESIGVTVQSPSAMCLNHSIGKRYDVQVDGSSHTPQMAHSCRTAMGMRTRHPTLLCPVEDGLYGDTTSICASTFVSERWMGLYAYRNHTDSPMGPTGHPSRATVPSEMGSHSTRMDDGDASVRVSRVFAMGWGMEGVSYSVYGPSSVESGVDPTCDSAELLGITKE